MTRPPPTKYGTPIPAAPAFAAQLAVLQAKAGSAARTPPGHPPPSLAWPGGKAPANRTSPIKPAGAGLVLLPKPIGKLLPPPPPAAGGIIQRYPARNVIQRMDVDSDEESEVDVSYESDAEFVPDPNDDGVDPEEFIGVKGETRPASYGSQFTQIYTGGTSGNFTFTNSLGTKTYHCHRFACACSKHSPKCDTFVYVVKKTEFSPTTPVSKKVNTKYVTRLERPPMCHIVDWVILRDGLKAYCGTNSLNSAIFEKFVCWGNYDNLTTGRRTCNIKSNKNQPKYDTISKAKRQSVDRYIAVMVKRQQANNEVCGNYGSIYSY